MLEKEYLNSASQLIADKYEEASLKLDQGKFNKAEKMLEKILEMDSEFVPAYNKLAVIYLNRDEIEEARKNLATALNIDSQYPPALTNYGSLEKLAGNFAEAKEYYQAAIDRNSEYGPAYNNMAVILREEGKYKDSVSYLKKARKHGTLSFDVDKKKSLLQEPGCLIPIIISGVMIFLLLYWFLISIN